MSKDLIQALDEAASSLNYIANTACKRDEELMSDAINVRGYARSRAKAASEALSRHRSSVESVELPENGSLAFSYVRHCVAERMAGFNAALGNKKDDDGDALPEPYGYAWHTGRINENGGYEASFGFSLDEPEALEAAPMYDATTVRSLIASAVEREREECAKVCGDEAVFRQGKASMIGIDSHAGAEWNAHSGFEAGRIACAAAISARGEK